MSHPVTAVLLACLALAVATPAPAAEKCKARIDKKTGEILVSASNVVGTPGWYGGSPDSSRNPFPELASCQKGTKLASCRIGAAGTVGARRAPSSCTLAVADDAGVCEATIAGCTASSMMAAFVSEVGMQGNWALSRTFGAVGLVKGAAGEYEIEFERSVEECFPAITLFSPGQVSACNYCGATERHLTVSTANSAGSPTDLRFYAVVFCP